MPPCRHEVLTLIPMKSSRLRCRHCHLTISEDELGSGDCPECLEVHRIGRRDFEKISAADKETIRYCCEHCGTVIEC